MRGHLGMPDMVPQREFFQLAIDLMTDGINIFDPRNHHFASVLL